jgi:hypothetical protein
VSIRVRGVTGGVLSDLTMGFGSHSTTTLQQSRIKAHISHDVAMPRHLLACSAKAHRLMLYRCLYFVGY